MNADGKAKTRVYRSGCCLVSWAAPVWAPDGRSVAFSVDLDGADADGTGLFLVGSDGSDLRRLSMQPADGLVGLVWQIP